MLLDQNKHKRTAWDIAVKGGKADVLENLWEWTKEILNTDEINKYSCWQKMTKK